MKQAMRFIKSHSLVIGIVLMFLLTWPIDLAHSGVLHFEVPFVIYIFLGWGFVLASITMTGLTLGREGVKALLKRFLIWRVGWKWYLVTFLLYPVIMISAVLLNAAFTRTPIDFSQAFAHKIFGPSANLLVLILPFLVFEAVANGEEIGWRGYVLPRLQAKHSAFVSSLIVGVIWGVWHFPKFLVPGNDSSFALFMLKVMADAILYTWLFNNTKGSLLLATLFHASSNTAGVFLPIANTVTGNNMGTLILQVLFQIVAAIVVVMIAGPERLSRTKSVQVQGSESTLSNQISQLVS
ncbi:MAG TPA: type II CAAX endopeptidase family protein [Anaerolineales bacterium]|nr:type II CAAX endopeptidase family protein [Anaerolineales bacterium]